MKRSAGLSFGPNRTGLGPGLSPPTKKFRHGPNLNSQYDRMMGRASTTLVSCSSESGSTRSQAKKRPRGTSTSISDDTEAYRASNESFHSGNGWLGEKFSVVRRRGDVGKTVASSSTGVVGSIKDREDPKTMLVEKPAWLVETFSCLSPSHPLRKLAPLGTENSGREANHSPSGSAPRSDQSRSPSNSVRSAIGRTSTPLRHPISKSLPGTRLDDLFHIPLSAIPFCSPGPSSRSPNTIIPAILTPTPLFLESITHSPILHQSSSPISSGALFARAPNARKLRSFNLGSRYDQDSVVPDSIISGTESPSLGSHRGELRLPDPPQPSRPSVLLHQPSPQKLLIPSFLEFSASHHQTGSSSHSAMSMSPSHSITGHYHINFPSQFLQGSPMDVNSSQPDNDMVASRFTQSETPQELGTNLNVAPPGDPFRLSVTLEKGKPGSRSRFETVETNSSPSSDVNMDVCQLVGFRRPINMSISSSGPPAFEMQNGDSRERYLGKVVAFASSLSSHPNDTVLPNVAWPLTGNHKTQATQWAELPRYSGDSFGDYQVESGAPLPDRPYVKYDDMSFGSSSGSKSLGGDHDFAFLDSMLAELQQEATEDLPQTFIETDYEAGSARFGARGHGAEIELP